MLDTSKVIKLYVSNRGYTHCIARGRMDTKSVLWFLSLLLGCRAQEKSYSGYEIIKTETVSKNNLKILCHHTGQWDFLSGPIVGHPAQILVPPEECSKVEQALNSENITFKVVEKNLQRLLDESKKYELPRLREGSVSYHKYMTLSEIQAYLDTLEKLYPKFASVDIIGYSTEGRPIKVVKISSGGENKPAIFVDATIHAREWIAPCAALFLIDQLAGKKLNRDLVDKIDWYIVPVVNVDGFEFSHTEDRMWRKTRSDTGHSNCRGVDGNRNFPFHWEGTFENHPCSVTYPGKAPMSEPEIQALVNFTESIKDRMKLYVAIHAFGPDLLYPWGYTETPIEDEADVKALGDKVVAAVRAASGTTFSCGSMMELMYKAPGNSADWAKGELGVKYSYVAELNSGGYFAFDPPPEVILPTVAETFAMFRAFGQYFGSGGE